MTSKHLIVVVLLVAICLGALVFYGWRGGQGESESQYPPIESGKGRIILELEDVPEEITTRRLVDNFFVGVGTTDPEGTDYIRTVLNDLRIGGVNYFLPATTWGLIEQEEGSYTWVPWLEDFVHWAEETGAVQNGHMLIFFHDQPYLIPEFVFDRPFDEQKERLENFVKAAVSHFQEIEIWTLNEPIAQNFLGWSREQNYDVFVSVSKLIHEINPGAKVMINMIPIQCNWSGFDYDPNEVLDDLLDRGLEADIIGIELYYWWAGTENRDENGYPMLDWVADRLDIFKRYNLPIIFSEVGVPYIIDGGNQLDAQADWMEAFFRFCYNQEDVIGATWYLVRDDPFMPYGGLTNDDCTYRPVAERLIEIANEWNPSTTHDLNGQRYLDLGPGGYDVIVNQEIFRVSVVEGQAVMITGGD